MGMGLFQDTVYWRSAVHRSRTLELRRGSVPGSALPTNFRLLLAGTPRGAFPLWLRIGSLTKTMVPAPVYQRLLSCACGLLTDLRNYQPIVGSFQNHSSRILRDIRPVRLPSSTRTDRPVSYQNIATWEWANH